ncbi:hypothetical protein A0U89_15735 (plasmid) [Kozakia baliensis]|uniref:Uncharacterized protein n=1 Tax=Kozakia baliensis TaxID=153496 RepID=A0A1D8UYM2_9PROT|nr:hypothetical protein A0U89_15735 [Kozakia baliensis]
MILSIASLTDGFLPRWSADIGMWREAAWRFWVEAFCFLAPPHISTLLNRLLWQSSVSSYLLL